MRTTIPLACLLTATVVFTGCDTPADKEQHANEPRIIHGANEDKPTATQAR